MGELSGVDAKIARAKTQAATLKASIEEALSPGNQRFDWEWDEATGQHLLRVFGTPSADLLSDWRILVGELLYDLRSALDHLAWLLVLLAGKTPGDRTTFPVRFSPFDQEGNLVGAQFTPPITDEQILDLVESCQPYRGVQGSLEPPDRSHLWQLHRLNIIDKHRTLLVVAGVFAVNDMWWGWNDDYGPSPRIRYNLAALRDGSPVAWFDFHGNDPPPDFDPHPALQVSFYESEFPNLVMVPIQNWLESTCWWIEHYIVEWRFRPLFD